MQRSVMTKAACALLILFSAATISCGQTVKPAITQPVQQPVQQQTQAAQPASTDNLTSNEVVETPETGPSVQIMLVHFRGTLEPLGCCNNLLYERDEYVAIKNVSRTPQDIRGWKLTNLTRGYPVFTFPVYYPCIPINKPELKADGSVENSFYRYIENPADSVLSQFSKPSRPAEVIQNKIDWSQCGASGHLDETPMRPVGVEGSQPALCILYPGQTVLVFTDEIHCQYGGFTFNYGLGNIWDNRKPDTAVLYDNNGEEVSRRSYSAGR